MGRGERKFKSQFVPKREKLNKEAQFEEDLFQAHDIIRTKQNTQGITNNLETYNELLNDYNLLNSLYQGILIDYSLLIITNNDLVSENNLLQNDFDNLVMIGNDVVPYPYAIDSLIGLANTTDYEWICSRQLDSKSMVLTWPQTRRYFEGPLLIFTDFDTRPWEKVPAGYSKEVKIDLVLSGS